MKTKSLNFKTGIIILFSAFIFACNTDQIDPALVLDEVFLPESFQQINHPSPDALTRLEELRLENPENHYYYLQLENGPSTSRDELMFPQKELLIEHMDIEHLDGNSRKYHGVIVKKIKGDWRNEEFKFFETQPQPTNGLKGFYTMLSENIKYPKSAKEAGIEGKVFVEFLVNKDGSLSEIIVKRGIGYGCDEEAVRVLKEASKWVPAKVMDKNVTVRMILPISYKLG